LNAQEIINAAIFFNEKEFIVILPESSCY